MAQVLEADLKKDKYKPKSDWDSVIESFEQGSCFTQVNRGVNTRANLLSLRRR
jgi:hypothetical protein